MNGLGYSGLLQIKYDIRLFREDALLSPCSGSNWWKPYNIILDHDSQISPEMQVNEMQALYDKYHKVSSFPKSHQNTILSNMK